MRNAAIRSAGRRVRPQMVGDAGASAPAGLALDAREGALQLGDEGVEPIGEAPALRQPQPALLHGEKAEPLGGIVRALRMGAAGGRLRVTVLDVLGHVRIAKLVAGELRRSTARLRIDMMKSSAVKQPQE